MPCELAFPLYLVGTDITVLMFFLSSQYCPLTLSSVFYPEFWGVSSRVHAGQHSTNTWGRGLSAHLWRSLSLSVLCSVNSSCVGLLRSPVPSPPVELRAPLEFPFSVLWLGNSLHLREVQGLACIITHILQITALHCLMSNVFKCFIYFVLLNVD